MKTLFQIVLIIIIGVLTWLLYDGIMIPIRFEKEKAIRYAAVIHKLKDIRTAQIAYKDQNGKFTGSFDTLIDFLKNGKMKVVKSIGQIDEDLLATMTEAEAVKKKLIIRDTVLVPIADTLFKKGYCFDSLRYIPFTNGVQFKLGAGTILTGSKVKVRVFEASALNTDILHGLNQQLIINLNDGAKFPGLRVGSLEEPNNNAGNWE